MGWHIIRETCKSCGKARRHYAKGMCILCYQKFFHRRYAKTEKCRAWRKAYNKTAKFLTWKNAYCKSEAYRVSHARYYLKGISPASRKKLFKEMVI